MAITPDPQSGPNQGPATPTQSGPPRPSNPLSGTEYAQLGEEINRLKQQMDAGSLSAKELAQEQANLIDNHQALVGMRIKEMAAADSLSRRIKELTASTTPAARESATYKSKLSELEKGLKTAQERATDLHKAAKQVGEALNKVVRSSEAKTKIETEAAEKQGATSKLFSAQAKETGAAMYKAAGPMGNIGKVAALTASKSAVLGAALSKTAAFMGGPWAGGFLAVFSALSQIFKAGTRETTAFTNAYGAQLGMAIRQQNEFKASISALGRMTIDVAKIQKLGSAAMKAGAFDAFIANQMVGRGYANMDDAATALAARLGSASEMMMRFGLATGLNEEMTGKLLGLFATRMGAFDAAAANSDLGLKNTINRFGQLNRMTGLALPNLFSMIEQMSDSSLQLGVSFNTTTTQAGMAIKAIADYGQQMKKSGDMALASGPNVERFFKSLVQHGAAISATTITGYDLARGMGTGKSPERAILDNMRKSPMERLNAQLKTFQQMSGSTDRALLMMRQSGASEAMVRQLDALLSMKGAGEALEVASTARDPKQMAEMLKGYAPELQKGVADIATMMQVTRDPLEQLVDLTKNSITYLSQISTQIAKAISFIPGAPKFAPIATPQASEKLARSIPLGGGNH